MTELFKISKEIIGLTENEAIEIIVKVDGLYQIEHRDGNDCHVINGFRDDRITMSVVDKIITEAYIY